MQYHDTPPNSFETNTKDINPHCSCFNLRKASRAVTQFYDRLFDPVGIRSTQFNLLVTMASVSAHTLTEMAQVLVMDRTTLTRNLKPLEKMGLIQTVRARDKRSRAYALTDKGRATVITAIPLWKSAQQRMIDAMGATQFQQFNRELESVIRLVNDL